MRARRALVVASIAALAVLLLNHSGAQALPPAPPEPTCSPGPASCFAWHTSNVTVSWASPPAGVTVKNGCGQTTVTADTGGTSVSCEWSEGGGSRSTTVSVRKDSTPPSVSGALTRGPDAGGWYNHAVAVDFSGSDATSGISSCTSGSYGGPDSASASASGSCSDNAGNTGSTSVALKYDATPPAVEAKADRKADSNGWYNHQVTVAFVGTDPTAGVDACDPAVLYKGPDSPTASLSGTCRDKAANPSPPVRFELRYDTTPPKLGRVRTELRDRGVALRWTASKDTHSFAIVRRPGLKGSKPSTLYTGKGRAFTDGRVKSGVKYRYTVTAYDEAGNGAAKVLLAQPKEAATRAARPKPAIRSGGAAALTKPAEGARLKVPPLLAWSAVRNATYYNVQLYRGGTKILTLWPSEPRLRIPQSWKNAGRAYRLTPGVYTWYVWAGFGPRSANHYGKVLGKRTFVVLR